ncbi:TPA: restriction endonuclease subunit S, partial [Streptococcus pneumoniae]
IFINSPYGMKQISGMEAGGAQKNVNAGILQNLLIPLPSLDEQKQISNFILKLDNTITLHQRKLDLLKEQKKGYLQKMFPKNGSKIPELRFAGFADDWEERKLGDTETHFTDGNYGESYPSTKDMSDKANGIPFLRGSDFSNGYLDSSNANYIKPEKHAELTSGHIKQDDIVLAVRGSLGTLGYATKENEGWNINSQLAILRTNKSEISGMFLIQYLLGSKGQKEIFSRNTGTALKQLPIKQLKDIPVPVPTLLEQKKIGSFFKQLDNTIALHQRKLDLLKEQKKGFLQKMFV